MVVPAVQVLYIHRIKKFIIIWLILDTQDYIGCYDYDSLDKAQTLIDQEI